MCFLLDTERDRRQVARTCGQLADRRCPGRAVLPGRPGRLRRRGHHRLAALRLFPQASCDLRVSSFLLFVFSICLAGIYFLLSLNKFSSAGAAMGAAATANVGSLAAAGGAALSAGVGAAASAFSALLPSGDAPRETGAIPKRKVNSC
jgi:hypothetical protein